MKYSATWASFGNWENKCYNKENTAVPTICLMLLRNLLDSGNVDRRICEPHFHLSNQDILVSSGAGMEPERLQPHLLSKTYVFCAREHDINFVQSLHFCNNR